MVTQPLVRAAAAKTVAESPEAFVVAPRPNALL